MKATWNRNDPVDWTLNLEFEDLFFGSELCNLTKSLYVSNFFSLLWENTMATINIYHKNWIQQESLYKMVLLCNCYEFNILESVKVLISSSIANIQETARWQFCKNTQFPNFIASLIILSAMGPCPCPSEIDCTLN